MIGDAAHRYAFCRSAIAPRKIRDEINPRAQLGIGMIPYAEKQVMHLCADTSELKKDTGWVSETDFRTGIREILNNSNITL